MTDSWKHKAAWFVVCCLAVWVSACGSDESTLQQTGPQFDGVGESPCPEGIAGGQACALPEGSLCAVSVACLCSGPQELACQCSGGQWSCPDPNCNERLPCPVPTTPMEDTSTGEDTSGEDTSDPPDTTSSEDTSGTSSGAEDTTPDEDTTPPEDTTPDEDTSGGDEDVVDDDGV